MKPIKFRYLLVILLSFQASCNNVQSGYTDPQAPNYDSLAYEDNDSSKYQVATVTPLWSKELGGQVSETSGLIHWDGALWTMNDDTDPRLYILDAESAEILGEYPLPGVENQDWEELAQDEDYLYVGDFGNNSGNRKNLHILRIEKLHLKLGNPRIDTIWFSYNDQKEFNSTGFNQTDFDCEAFIVASDRIYLFTKQWLSTKTSLYELSKNPGTHVAQKRDVFPIEGLVTGATFMEKEKLLVLCGYAGLMQPFLYLFYDYQGDLFFSGIHKRIDVNLPFHQVEGVVSIDGLNYYISNEHYTMGSYVDIFQKLHFIELHHYLEDYLNADY